MSKSMLTFKNYLDGNHEFQKFGKNDIAVFGLSMYLGIDDVDEFISSSWTEDFDDKKIDIFYIDLSEARAAIVQVYICEKFGSKSALGNKASDLNTACSWVFSANENTIPLVLKPKAVELRNAILNKEIERIDFLYVHNCYETVNVEAELRTVADGARDKIKALTNGESSNLQINYKEIGLNSIELLYRSRDKEILVEKEITLPKTRYIEENGDGWRAIQLTVSGNWIRDLYLDNKDNLFSANYRDYLGSINKKGNINFDITKTADNEPESFWVYNNGITALTNKIQIKQKCIKIYGISIINGAQTTGSLGESSDDNSKKIKVSFRFVECSDKDKVSNIIKFNNTQNEIKAFDRRSNDPIQKRLSMTFKNTYSINYQHRRSQLRAPKNTITAHSIAPLLCAFHGDPGTAHRQAKEIFLQDEIYKKVFNDSVGPEHVFMVKALSNAVDEYKQYLFDRVKTDEATDLDKEQHTLLKYSASKIFVFFVIGNLAEIILNKKVTSLFNWKAKTDIVTASNTSLSKAWIEVLQTVMPQVVFCVKKVAGENPFYEVPRSLELSRKVASEVKTNLASFLPTLGKQLDAIRKKTTL